MAVTDNSASLGFISFVFAGVAVVAAILAFVVYGGQPGPAVKLELPPVAQK
jgi:hypothetical protein